MIIYIFMIPPLIGIMLMGAAGIILGLDEIWPGRPWAESESVPASVPEDEDDYVRHAVALNPATPPEVLAALAGDC
jgi:hypothetical protein